MSEDLHSIDSASTVGARTANMTTEINNAIQGTEQGSFSPQGQSSSRAKFGALSGDPSTSMKVCLKCGQTKPLYQFYSSNLTNCKDCIKASVRQQREVYMQDPAWRLRERERCRLKQDRFRKTATPEQLERLKKQADASRKRWIEGNKPKLIAERMANNALRAGKLAKPACCEWCGASSELEKHHTDYSKPLDVVWLCIPCHAKTRRLGDAPIQRRAA
jgi:hypothetical protein